MKDHRRRILFFVAIVISMTLLAAPARGADWFGFHVGSHGFGLSVGYSSWPVYGSAWGDPSWSVSYDVVLAGYGEWVLVDGIGRVWRPWVAAGWQPYTHGRWLWTSYGWTWVAYEPWGYFPHHYGHWAHSYHGWVWVPGYSYRAANVVWVSWGSHVGWYACPPRGWSHWHRGYHHGYRDGHRSGYGIGYRDGWNDARYANYVEWRDLGTDDVSRRRVLPSTLERAAPRSTPTTMTAPPTRTEARRRGAVELPRNESRNPTRAGG